MISCVYSSLKECFRDIFVMLEKHDIAFRAVEMGFNNLLFQVFTKKVKTSKVQILNFCFFLTRKIQILDGHV